MRKLGCAVVLAASLAACTGSPSNPPAGPASPTSSTPPPPSPLESWVSLLCVVDLKNAPDPALYQAPAVTADPLPAAKRRLTQWANAVGDAATTMTTELTDLGPPPGGGGLAKVFDEYHQRYADVADYADSVPALIDATTKKADLDLTATLLEVQLLTAIATLDGDPELSALTEENPLCM
ncbi:MAG TPA: hypothetical protein VHH15_14405 [Actinophytocola sp.]|nr:hypothetical protein [Actinophytocola sp.]